MTYWPNPPDLLIFQCKSIESKNDEEGGETVVFDNEAAAAELDQTLLGKDYVLIMFLSIDFLNYQWF